MASWFFLSYARDDQHELLDEFYSDLCEKIRLATRLRANEVGFLDRNDIQLANKWDSKLAEALRSCKVLVSICTPNYFDKEYCGKEFQVCLERQATLPGTATAMFCVIWGMPIGSVHPAMEKFQYNHRSLPPIYAEQGLRYMMELNKHRDEYKEFITRFAQAIVKAGTEHPLPELPTLQSMRRVKNAFQKTEEHSSTLDRNAYFSFVAGAAHQFSGVRPVPRDLPQRYGKGGKYWRPFYPEYSDSVGNAAMSAASDQKMFFCEFPPNKDLVDSIKRAEDERQVVILLVDPWSISIKSYREIMEEYDRTNFENCAVLVAWNSLKLTQAQREKYQSELARVFKFRTQFQRSVYYVDSIFTDKDLRTTLAQTLVRLQNGLIEKSDLQQGISHHGLVKKARRKGIELRRQPIVTGPGDRRR